jgi:hypothetical protein
MYQNSVLLYSIYYTVYKQLLSHHNNTHTECIAAVAVVVFVIIVGFSLVTVLLLLLQEFVHIELIGWSGSATSHYLFY